MSVFKHAGHLWRLAAVFAVGTIAFFVIRALVVPHSFGEYGHYRGAAIGEIAKKPLHYGGHKACESCHSDIAKTKSAGKHAHVNCEACHGPQIKHAEDYSIDPGKPDSAKLCVRCHAESAARPKWFPQINVAKHAGGMDCDSCHDPHNPVIDTGGSK